MRKRAKKDNNQDSIVKALRMIPGLSVAITSQLGNGFPDLVIGYKSKNYLIELKLTNKSKLTPDEVRFLKNWCGHYAVCSLLEEILILIGIEEWREI